MPRPKSIIKRVELNEALKAHNCQHNSRHRIECGDKRLKVWKPRSVEYFCVDCALEVIERDIQRLKELKRKLESE